MSVDHDTEQPYALRLGREELFKFRPYTTGEDKRRVAEILVEHKVYFARASQLNDPFDMSPRFQISSREELIAAGKSFRERHPDLAHTVDLDYLATCDLFEHATRATAHARRGMEKGYPVLSLAGNREAPMLWSHYAQGHTGLCIHFKTDERVGWFGYAVKVEYVDVRPLLPATMGILSESEVMTRIVLQKGKFWSYEDEFRWIAWPNSDYPPIKFRREGQHGLFRASALGGVTLGARMPEKNVREVIEIARGHVPALPVWQAREKDTYEFEFERLA